jgi:hypothetical protein
MHFITRPNAKSFISQPVSVDRDFSSLIYHARTRCTHEIEILPVVSRVLATLSHTFSFTSQPRLKSMSLFLAARNKEIST